MTPSRPALLYALRALLLGLALGAAGCSSFNRDWKAAAGPGSPDSIGGRWEGRWRSEANGHTDSLRCLITRGTNDTCSARFHAKYRAVFRISFGYTVPLKVERRGDEFQFEGSASLGALAGGRYTYKGRATTTNFFSTYSCKYDHGIFEMTRPPPAP